MKKLLEYLKTETKESMMRLAFFWSLLLVSIMFIIISIHILKMTICHYSVDWEGLAWFITGLAAFALAFITGKVWQKGKEIEQTKEIQPIQGGGE